MDLFASTPLLRTICLDISKVGQKRTGVGFRDGFTRKKVGVHLDFVQFTSQCKVSPSPSKNLPNVQNGGGGGGKGVLNNVLKTAESVKRDLP